MIQKHSIWALAAGLALLAATGCNKPETAATPAVDDTSKNPVPVVSGIQQPPPPPQPPSSQPESTAKVKPAAIAPPIVPPPTASATAVASPAAVTIQPVAKPPVSSESAPARAPAPSLAPAGANQFQALALAATNKALTALAVTNQVVLTATNQVQALLEQAKSLTANQKYQEALGTITQLYATKLTPAQKQQADDLKVQIQTAMTQKAASSLGNILGGQK